jgi:hypothetical protein
LFECEEDHLTFLRSLLLPSLPPLFLASEFSAQSKEVKRVLQEKKILESFPFQTFLPTTQ